MPPKQKPKAPQKNTKQQPKKSAKPAGSGKAKKKKWSKGKVRDKLNNLALFDNATYEKMNKEVPSYKLITPAVLCERLKIRASLARRALEEMESKGMIKLVLKHHAQKIYTRAPKGDEN